MTELSTIVNIKLGTWSVLLPTATLAVSSGMLKQFLIAASLLSSGCVSILSHAEVPACKMSPTSNDGVAGRSFVVRFPDGRIINVVGHIHGERQIIHFGKLAESGELASIPNVQFSALLKKTLKDNRTELPFVPGHSRTVLSHAHEDREYLRALSDVEDRSRIAFVGLELFPDEALRFIDLSGRGLKVMREQFEERKKNADFGISDGEFEDMLLSSTSAATYELITNPNRYQRVAFVGTEGHEMKETELILQNGLNEILQSLTKMSAEYIDGPDFLAGSKILQPGMVTPSQFIKEFVLAGFGAQTQQGEILDKAELEAKLRSLPNVPSPYQHYVQKAKFGLVKLFDAAIDREVEVAKTLVARRENGVQFIGLLHLRRLGRNLERLCNAEK